MCNCRQEISKQLSERLGAEGQIVNFDLISGKTYSTFKHQHGRGKKTQVIFHNYCPFCGEQYDSVAGGDALDT